MLVRTEKEQERWQRSNLNCHLDEFKNASWASLFKKGLQKNVSGFHFCMAADKHSEEGTPLLIWSLKFFISGRSKKNKSPVIIKDVRLSVNATDDLLTPFGFLHDLGLHACVAANKRRQQLVMLKLPFAHPSCQCGPHVCPNLDFLCKHLKDLMGEKKVILCRLSSLRANFFSACVTECAAFFQPLKHLPESLKRD